MDGHRAASDPVLSLSWQSLVFLLPFGAAVFFLILSSLRLGGAAGHRHAGGGGGGHRGHPSSGSHAKHSSGSVKHHAAAKGQNAKGQNAGKPHVSPLGLLLVLVGANRAPLPLVVQTFCLAWGICGISASRIFLTGSDASGTQGLTGRFLLCLLVALVGGIIGARVGAELLARFLPQESTSVVSRDALYGLTGKVLFPVTASGGRVRVYDEWNTLHDEACRTKTSGGENDAAPPIDKGRTVRIVDRDETGRLVVEEVL